MPANTEIDGVVPELHSLIQHVRKFPRAIGLVRVDTFEFRVPKTESWNHATHTTFTGYNVSWERDVAISWEEVYQNIKAKLGVNLTRYDNGDLVFKDGSERLVLTRSGDYSEARRYVSGSIY